MGHRNYELRYAYRDSASGDYDRGYRNELQAYGAVAGDRRLEIVKGSVFSACQTYVTQPAQKAEPEPPRYPPPVRKGSGGGGGGRWCFNDPEMKRRRRVAAYKAYMVEGKLKASLRKGIRWIKAKCSELVHGF